MSMTFHHHNPVSHMQLSGLAFGIEGPITQLVTAFTKGALATEAKRAAVAGQLAENSMLKLVLKDLGISIKTTGTTPAAIALARNLPEQELVRAGASSVVSFLETLSSARAVLSSRSFQTVCDIIGEADFGRLMKLGVTPSWRPVPQEMAEVARVIRSVDKLRTMVTDAMEAAAK